MDQPAYQSGRYVMRPHVGWERVDAFANRFGRQLVHSNERSRTDGVDGQSIWADGTGPAVHYIVDATAGIGYVVITGDDRSAAQRVEHEVVRDLQPWVLDELLAAFDEAEELRDRMQYVLRIGLAAPEGFDENSFARISAGLSADDHRIRYAALWATTYTGYQEFVPVIESHLLVDGEEEFVQVRARSVLDSFRVVAGEQSGTTG